MPDPPEPLEPSEPAAEPAEPPAAGAGPDPVGPFEAPDGPAEPMDGLGAGQPADPTDSPGGMRNITDVRTLRALAHPVRIAILEALAMSGPLTATQVGERIGESPTTCSFHLRQLAKYHFVEEAGGGKGRARPWRMSSTGLSISAGDDPETAIAANSVRRLFRDRAWERYRTWTETDQMYPLPWRKAAAETETVYFVTADELQALNEELHEIIMHRYRDRLTDPSRRPPGSVPVEMLLLSYPIQLPDQED